VLYCDLPLTDPEAALDTAYDVWGVRAVELERSCRVNVSTDPSAASDTSVSGSSSDAAATSPANTTPSSDSTTSTTVPPEFGTLGEIIANDPQFSLLSVLAVEAGLDTVLNDPAAGPMTMFAPPDSAFESLGADALAQLRSDPELLRRVLAHHLVEAVYVVADLSEGPLEMMSNNSVEVAIVGPVVTVDGAAIIETDIAAGNGMLHVVEEVLIPADVDLGDLPSFATVSVSLADGLALLEGAVAGSPERLAMISAVASVDSVMVDDRLVVDADMGATIDVIEQLVELIDVMLAEFVSGSAEFDGVAYSITGVATSESGREQAVAAADSVGATAEVEVVEPLEPASAVTVAAQLDRDLNEFVDANPINFEPGAAILTTTAPDVVDQLAVMIVTIEGVTGVVVTVEGHTDSDGDPIRNLTLSASRAASVRAALIERGVGEASIDSTGYGSEFPVLVDGVEDKDASRRVEFQVVVAS